MDDPADNILEEEAPASVAGIATRSHPELEAETDDGLMTLMAFKDTDEELAMNACDELHRRHARFFLAWCIKDRRETFGASAEDFVNQAFLRAYNEARSFICTDKDDATSQVKAWLFRIMKNLYLDSLRAERRRPAVRLTDDEYERLEEIEEARQEEAEQVPSARKAAMAEFLKTLSPVDHEILTLTAEFWDPRKREAVIDDEVRAGFCRQYGLTESSLRVKRMRLKERAQAYIEQRTRPVNNT